VDHVGLLRAAFRDARRQRAFTIDAMVVLPDHLHAIWTLPPDDDDYAGRWRSIKSRFSHAVAQAETAIRRNPKGEYKLWQRRYWEHTIRDGNDLARHVDYIHYNPVKHGHTASPVEWPFSSFHRYVKQGLYAADWGSTEISFNGIGNE
jgi:putative transposase